MEKPEFYFSHVGINDGSPKETEEMVKFCRLLFGAGDIQESAHAYFAGGRTMEIQKGGGRGPDGHVAFYTPDLTAAMAYLDECGYELDASSAKYEEDGTMRLIYLKDEINGFAVHLTTRK